MCLGLNISSLTMLISSRILVYEHTIVVEHAVDIVCSTRLASASSCNFDFVNKGKHVRP